MKRLITILFIILLSVFISPINVFADGMIIPLPNRVVNETDQKAVIWHDGKTETLIISITFKGNTDEFAWVVPVPAKPDVDAGVDELFTGLAQLTGITGNINLMPQGEFSGISTPQKSTVTVIETKKVDIYDIAVLTADDTTDLREWLEENDYTYPEEKEHLLKSYVNKDWYFVAAKVNTESLAVAQGLRTGHATPLKITFDSEKIVYPLKISGMGSSPTTTSIGELVNAYSFEDNTTQGWYGGQVVSGGAYHGNMVISKTNNTISTESGARLPLATYIYKSNVGLTIGKNYTFSAYVKASPGTTGTAKLTLGNTTFSSQILNLANAGDWVRLELPFNATKTYYQFKLNSDNVNANGTVYWDAIQIEEGFKATDFTKELTIGHSPSVSLNPEDNWVDIILYVFSDHKQEVPGWNVNYAGKVDSKTIERLAVDDNGDPWIDAKNMYLTRLYRNIKQSEMTSDVYPRQSANDNPVGSGGNISPFNNIGLKIILVLVIPILVEVSIFGYIWYRRYKK